MFTQAIVRKPCEAIVNGLTTANLGVPNYTLACEQHQDYVTALRECGLHVTELAPLEDFPDSCFVEDVALLTQHCAILTHPSALSRKGEVAYIAASLDPFYSSTQSISNKGNAEAGDIMMVGRHFYIGLSQRTNRIGANEIIRILNQHGLSGSTVKMKELLHLKTGVSYLENDNLLAYGEMMSHPDFAQYRRIEIDEDEQYAANSVWINGTVLIPTGFPKTLRAVQQLGYQTREIAMSEFQKIDGGLSCLSLRF
ncbi:MAG: dimethylargininase [Gammaproteobacteria bacterium]|jgi:dimethylargininase